MKTSSKFIILFISAAAALSSCAKEIPVGQGSDPEAQAAEGSRVIAVSFAPSTKTYLGEDGLTPKFKKGDEIFLCTNPGNQEEIKTETRTVSVDEEGNATITTNLSGELTALYPVKAVQYFDKFGCYDIGVPQVQSGEFDEANICKATITAGGGTAHFANQFALFVITPPEGTQKLNIKSLPAIGNDGQRSGDVAFVNNLAPGEGVYYVTVQNAPVNGKYYVAILNGVKLSDLSFEAEFATACTGSIKGLPMKAINEAKAENTVASGTIYTINENNWHEYVTISGRKWATMNVGATKPEQSGYYFSWGNTEGHWLNGTADSYVFSEDAYASSSGEAASAFTDISGNVNYDAASANWGGAWRMPAIEDLRVLMALTDKGPVADYNSTGTAGYSFSDGGNSVFFPKAVAIVENEWCDDGGYYWSSTYNPLSSFSAHMYFETVCNEDAFEPYLGLPIRAIVDESSNVPAQEVTETLLPGVFKVGENKTVKFSRGLLYWDGDSFEFEENQLAYPQQTWNSSHVSHFFWSSSESVARAESYSDAYRCAGDILFTNATETTPNPDFTVNGVKGKYRSLSQPEIEYLISNSKILRQVTIGTSKYIVIAPSDYSKGINFSYTLEGWAESEKEGLICFPYCGVRTGTTFYMDDCDIYTSSPFGDSQAYRLSIYNDGRTYPKFETSRSTACSLRLVCDEE